MLVLGIETTCDETAAAVVERHPDGRATIHSNVVLSQIAEHAAFGGVVPEIAARAHVEALDAVIATAMADAGRDFGALDGVAAAAGPGLIGGVIVGLTTGKAIALVHEKPLIAVNHLEAHALTARLTDGTAFPYCLFLASGGHTQIVAVRGVGDYVRLGTTRDDAIGEAFDKTAKLLGLGYPGGPRVEEEAGRGNAARFTLPRPMIGRQDADFSLSGLKTALRLEAEKIAPLTAQDVADLCASFQHAVVATVIDRLRHGLRMFRERFGPPAALVASGGVAANSAIRAALLDLATENQLALVVPPPALCTDNGAMIAWAGAERLAYGLCDTLDTAPRARWPLAQVGKPPRGAPPFAAADGGENASEPPAVAAGTPGPTAEHADAPIPPAQAEAVLLRSPPPQTAVGTAGGSSPSTDQSSTDQSSTNQSTTDQSTTDQPGTDQPGTDQPGTDTDQVAAPPDRSPPSAAEGEAAAPAPKTASAEPPLGRTQPAVGTASAEACTEPAQPAATDTKPPAAA